MTSSAPSPARKRLKVLPIVELVLLVVLIALPAFVQDFHVVIVTRMLILAMLAVSFDMCWGYSGIMTFGQALFFGIAGYVVALLANKAGFTQIWGLVPITMLAGLAAAFLIGWFLLLGKRTPAIIFVALGTLTASYTAERLVAGWQWVGAGNGMSIFDFMTFGEYEFETGPVFYYLILAVLILAYAGSRWIVRSQFGLVLAGMRQNEARLAFLGYRVQVFKALVFSYAGMVAGLAGGLYAHHEGYIGPADLGIGLSTYAVLYGLFGGVGTLIGPVLGVFAIESIRFFLSDIDAIKTFWPVVLGVILLIVVTYKPTGLMGFVLSERERIGSFGRPAKKPAEKTPHAQEASHGAS
jgi:branched-chain amino acid transport system permease protein